MAHEVNVLPWLDTEPITIFTKNTIWFFKTDHYLRTPRGVFERLELPTIDGKGKDYIWHELDGLWYLPDENRYRVLPAGRPQGSTGIITGYVVDVLSYPSD